MSKHTIQKNRGFVILFAVTLSAILLSIALGVASVAQKEIRFSISAKDSDDAFFAADTGIELILFNDKNPSTYPPPPVGGTQSWNLVVPSLGPLGASCALVNITKDNTNPPFKTTVLAKGYNAGDATCTSSASNRVEREIDISY